jgi:glycosyltransferase involved in cell wall biosynthesis
VESLALCAEEAAWYRNKLQVLVRDLGLEGRVEMTGYLLEEEASRLLSGSDIGVLPFNEGVTLKSGALLTLFAHGLPVVATRPDPPEPTLIDGGRLRLVDRRDAPGLAITLLGLLADDPERARLGEAGRAYTRDLSWPKIAERHVEAYESVLARRQNASGSGSVRQVGTPPVSASRRELY